MLLSGGVDLIVCVVLLYKVLFKEQVIVVYIDNGFMRKNESQNVVQFFNKIGLNVKGNYIYQISVRYINVYM